MERNWSEGVSFRSQTLTTLYVRVGETSHHNDINWQDTIETRNNIINYLDMGIMKGVTCVGIIVERIVQKESLTPCAIIN
ncbi:hypothetical protein SESBI_15707 [Sesbania bispinosa]|nr:hypothetical protein SESBI_15707 [Sesbania bispinosa]